MFSWVHAWTEQNDVTFWDKHKAEHGPTGGQDGKDLHGYGIFATGAERCRDIRDPDTEEGKHAEGYIFGLIEACWELSSQEGNHKAGQSK